MAFTELSHLVERLKAGRLGREERMTLARQLENVRDVLLRLGAGEAAGQIELAVDLLVGGDPAADVEPLALSIVQPIERTFREIGLAPRDPPGAPARARVTARVKLGVARDMLLGEMLVHFGVIEQAQLERALEARRGSRRRLGEILIQQGATTEEELTRALAYQERLRAEAEPAPATPTRRAEPHRPAAPASPPPLASARPASSAAPSAHPRLRMARDLLLGEILVLQGALSRANLGRALEFQRRSGRLLGEALLELKLLSRRQLEAALTYQSRGLRSGSLRRAS